jgi:CO/xanthine dehydrogenase Mo-binding subunit
MARVRGRGVAAVNYPTGMNLGGDPSQALIHATTTGSFVVTLSSVDLGQGLRTIMTQIAAETLGVPPETVMIDTADTDTGPHCMGTFASRGTHRIGNAIVMAATEAKKVLLDVAAEELEVDVEDIETDGKGRIEVKGAPGKSIAVLDVALAAHFKHGRTISGRGIFLKPRSYPDGETGAMDPDSCQAHACTVAEVEVDTETGVVVVLKLTSAYEVGRALNPRMVEQQIVGGAWMGMSHALYETTEPCYPDRDHGPIDFLSYLMPGPADSPVYDALILERPAKSGPYGAKGVGEMTANSPIPAIANAIFDACGVRIDELPITPERVLRALDAARAASPTPAEDLP